jgi:ABC-type thiamin/hydroxymethylpyrimidine transport system permease subunit
MTPDSARRAVKFRQAAFAYLHVAILYEAAAYVMWRQDLLPTRFGPPWLWLLFAAGMTAVIVYGLLRWQNVWFARAVWLVHGLRLPALINGAFFAGDEARVVPAFYLTAMVVVVINLWMLARAAWDL